MHVIEYAEPYERAAEILRLAISRMAEHRVTPNPINFAVWYAHLAGKLPALSSELERRLAGGERFDDRLARELYVRHLVDDDMRAVADLRETLKRVTAEVLRQVVAAGGEASRYGAALEGLAQRLTPEIEPEELHRLIDRALDETRGMVAAGRRLEERLEEATREVEELRRELARVREEATTDPLTGLANRGAFDEALAQALAAGGPLALILADIDHFKRINDRWGHLMGDRVLRFVAGLLREAAPEGVRAARFGGEEFALLLPGAGLDEARALAESLRTALASGRLRSVRSGERIGRITMSLGVAVRAPGDDAEALVARADRALYRAKELGRNRVEVEEAAAPV